MDATRPNSRDGNGPTSVTPVVAATWNAKPDSAIPSTVPGVATVQVIGAPEAFLTSRYTSSPVANVSPPAVAAANVLVVSGTARLTNWVGSRAISYSRSGRNRR